MFSIITGTLNRVKTLPKLIKNTVDSFSKMELIILDGGSTDGSVEYLKNLKNSKIKLIEIGHRSSWPSFMNMGIEAAKYDWILQWNDDVLLRNTWEDVENIIDNHKAYAFSWNRCNDPGNCLTPNCINFGMVHRSLFEEFGMYDPTIRFYGGDWDFTQRLKAFNQKINLCEGIWVEEIISHQNPDNWTGQDDKIGFSNIKLYKQGIIPERIPKLRRI